MLQAAPPAQRAAALDGERTLLARWGTVRQNLPARPVPSVDSEAARLIGQVRAGGKRPPLALSPMLAHTQISRPEKESNPESWTQRCARAQWWLSMQDLSDEDARSRALTAFRYAILVLPTDRYEYLRKPPAEDSNGYPVAASTYGVGGLLTLRLQIDADGKLRSAEVRRRAIEMPGIRGNPPVAFEPVLDEFALTKAKAQHYVKPDAEKLRNGVIEVEQEFQFNLKNTGPKEAKE